MDFRSEILDTFWYFAHERNEIMYRRLAGEKPPFTTDPILVVNKFCNSYRAMDRVSQFLIREVCYARPTGPNSDLAFRIVLFRIFSRISTWDYICSSLGSLPTIDHLHSGGIESALASLTASGERVYTGAFILCATDAYGYDVKYRNHLALLREMFPQTSELPKILTSGSLRDLFCTLKSYPLMGDFMSYQIAIDLNYSELFNFNENDFVVPGPGAVRGIQKLCKNVKKSEYTKVIFWLVEHQSTQFRRLDIPFRGLWGRPLTAVDMQNLCCEVDKYSRAAFPDLLSKRTRIKARYEPGRQLPAPTLPPKWGINPQVFSDEAP